MDISKVECCHCGKLVDRIDMKQYTVSSTGERFLICRKCAQHDNSC